jgi:hypothetical protein
MDPNSKRHRINYQVLFEAWGIKLTPTEVEETQISISRALQVAAKCTMIKYICYSKRIIGKMAVKLVTSTVNIPNMLTLAEESL